MAKDAFRLDGSLALVTGGGTGLGLGICQGLTEAGARVVITGRREEVLREACAQLGEASRYLRHDVQDLPSIPALIERVERDIGPLDILVNNAGNHLKKPALDTTDAEMANVMQTHFFGAFAMAREAGKRMTERKRGAIVMICSMTSFFGIPWVSAYTSAKTALMGLTRALAVEYAPHGVRVNAIAPGFFNTALNRKAYEGDPPRLQRILARTPMGRLGEESDVGYAAVYLCSPAAKFVNGVVLPIDGGFSIGF
jgi:gluconate 5-dehydrogenase